MSLHSFDPDIAARVGINAAVLYQNILFWTQKNAANNKSIRDGYVWTYNSRRAFAQLFPYFSESQIKTAITKLIESGLLLKGDYNQENYDKTNWYALTESAHWINSAIGQKSPMDWSKIANRLDKNRQPIPDSKPVIKPDGKHYYMGGSIEQISPDRFEEFWDQYPHRGGAKKGILEAKKSWAKAIKRGVSQSEIIAGAIRYANDNQVINGYAKNPATWLNQEGWTDEIEPTNNNRPNGSGSGRAGAGMASGFAAVAARFDPGST
ncbi:MAG: hypothetical protein U5K75_12200 [Ahrensia sp.]|nr:hypothetical protein [Ahrensia sp.]